MRAAFLKALRWYAMSFFVAVGTTALMYSEKTGFMWPVIFGVAGYGTAYVMSALWKDFRGPSLAWGIAAFTAISMFSPNVADILYVLFAYDDPIDPFALWFANLTIIGIPLMTIIYTKIR